MQAEPCFQGLSSTLAMPVTELQPGLTISVAEDPDGNWVEFVQQS